jgi:membrane protease YdiL (CAAX protease family)
VFVVLAFAVPWVVAPWLPQQPQNTWELILSYLPGVWAPTVIAIVMIALTRGLPGLARELSERLRVDAAGGIWLLAAAVIPALVTAAGLFVARTAGEGQSFIPASAFGTVVLSAISTGAVGEELGWRGFVLSRLGQRVSQRTAGLVMAILWGLWHLPIFLFPDSPYSTWPLVPALLTIMAFGFFMAALFFATQGSVIPTILAHLSLNITLGVGGVQLSSAVFWWVLAGTFLLIGAWCFRRSERPSQRPVVAAAS